MDSLNISFNKTLDQSTGIDKVARLLSNVTKEKISFVPWPSYSYRPEVSFSLLMGTLCFGLQFRVREQEIKAVFNKINDPVYKDSCVEFFISFNGSANYYNLEFNCIGAVYCAFGSNRYDRQLVPDVLLRQVITQSVLQKHAQDVHWELTALIPFSVFPYDDLSSIKGQSARANFYKCGDGLDVPHFLSWSDIQSDEPDFHLPQFFGSVQF